MKNSKPNETKIHKHEQRKIDRYCSNIIGLHVGINHWDKIIDQAKINGVMYLLAMAKDKTLAIYKMVKVGEAVKLSPKKIIENKLNFCNKEFWRKQSIIKVDDDGKISQTSMLADF